MKHRYPIHNYLPQNLESWKRTPVISVLRPKYWRQVSRPELLEHIQAFLQDHFSRVGKVRDLAELSLSFVFRRLGGSVRRLLIRINPLVHLSGQHLSTSLAPVHTLSLFASIQKKTLHQSEKHSSVATQKEILQKTISNTGYLFNQERFNINNLFSQIHLLYPVSHTLSREEQRSERGLSGQLQQILQNLFQVQQKIQFISIFAKQSPDWHLAPIQPLTLTSREQWHQYYDNAQAVFLTSVLNRPVVSYSSHHAEKSHIAYLRDKVSAHPSQPSSQFLGSAIKMIKPTLAIARTRNLQVTVMGKRVFQISEKQVYRKAENRAGVSEPTVPMVKRLVSRLSTVEKQVQQSSLSYVFTNQTQILNSTLKSHRQIVEDEEFVKRIQRQIQEENKRLEKKLSMTVASAEEMTDQVYGRLTRRLQVEKERLGY